MIKNNNISSGFTLLELSIVLVILGLLVGGVLTGQSLIKGAELRAVQSEHKTWLTAMNIFYSRYKAIPGDMKDAETLWPSAYNGNGDRMIQTPSSANQPGEVFGFWQQLMLAGLIDGNYTGRSGPESYVNAVFGVNTPGSAYDGAGWTARYCPTGIECGENDFNIVYGNHLTIGATDGVWDTDKPIFTPSDAMRIDQKMDDGHPAKGNVVALFWDNECSYPLSGAAAPDNLNVAYNTTSEKDACALVFRQILE